MSTNNNDMLLTPLQALAQRCAQHGNRVAMVQPLDGGKLKHYTWNQINDEARRIASYLSAEGVQAGDHVALISQNCAEWVIADLAIWMVGAVSVPLYPSLTAATVRQILEHSESRLLFVGKLTDWDSMKGGVPDGVKQVALSLASARVRQDLPVWDDILRQQSPLEPLCEASLGELATIIYTSGTTGMPKGVMHSFRSFAVVGRDLAERYRLTADDRMLSYLPLSHVAERAAVEITLLYVGHTTYFARSADAVDDDLKRAQPTVFFAVPGIWSRFYQKVHEKMPAPLLDKLLRVPVLNQAIKRKMLASMGLDTCRIAVSGAAALAPDIIVWFRRLGLEILEGYGMTENLTWSHATAVGDQAIGWVGTPNKGVRCKLGEDGEILVNSPCNMLGYFKDPDKTRADLSDDGWLRTGDVGEMDGEGRLRVTGRVKDIFKTEKGKYVAPTPIENQWSAVPGVEMACVLGEGLAQPIGLLTLVPDDALRLRGEGRVEVDQMLADALARINASLDPHERLSAVVVCAEPWCVGNGLVTATFKIKRNEIARHYGPALRQWSAQRGVIWQT